MNAINRRDFFRSFFGRSQKNANHTPQEEMETAPVLAPKSSDANEQLALILDRFCLAHQGSFCSTCAERCPVPGAITTEMGKPRVQPDLCTGCRICHDVCPAPKNAVFFVSRKPRIGMIGRTVAETAPCVTDEPA